ncbi:hypothetical protein [Enterobacter hormaechei]|uniref:hypothetical protein n=1 Tax=Enterobacter hormaechei TaxID=158836 RepID=UPI001F28BE77|nr:hypothetical protein [Enterobacter hormaechei]
MAEYGVQTWDASGKVNNYGVKPVSVCGYLQLAQNQKTGSYTVALPPGCRLTYFQSMNGDQFGTSRRKITISGEQQQCQQQAIPTTQQGLSLRQRLISFSRSRGHKWRSMAFY